MEEIPFEEAIKRLFRGEILQRCPFGSEDWVIVQMAKDGVSFDELQDKPTTITKPAATIASYMASKWRCVQECVPVQWHEALKWMSDNRGKECKVSWPDNPKKIVRYSWSDGWECFVVTPDMI